MKTSSQKEGDFPVSALDLAEQAVRRLARRFPVLTREDVDDTVSETAIILHTRWDRIQNHPAYARKVALRCLVDAKNSRNSVRILSLDDPDFPMDGEWIIDRSIPPLDEQASIHAAFEELTDDEAKIIRSRYEGLSLEATARQSRSSVSIVRTRMNRVRTRLADYQ